MLQTLAKQTCTKFEVIVVLKPFKKKEESVIKKLCEKLGFNHKIIIQKRGYFTHALNIGKQCASGDLLLFTDDDTILPPLWVQQHAEIQENKQDTAAVSGREVRAYSTRKLYRLKPREFLRELHRMTVYIPLHRPHKLFAKYKCGVYITKDYEIAYGPCIPTGQCFSLPWVGCNMSFKKEAMYGIEFPEHSLLKRGWGNEQYVGVQLIKQGFDCIYMPKITVLHLERGDSLSRQTSKDQVLELNQEKLVMKALIEKLLSPQDI